GRTARPARPARVRARRRHAQHDHRARPRRLPVAHAAAGLHARGDRRARSRPPAARAHRTDVLPAQHGVRPALDALLRRPAPPELRVARRLLLRVLSDDPTHPARVPDLSERSRAARWAAAVVALAVHGLRADLAQLGLWGSLAARGR